MHNAKFDIRALDSIGLCLNFPGWPKREGKYQVDCHSLEDTLVCSHTVASLDNHGLKELAIKYFQYADTDEKKLKALVNKACLRAAKLGWKLGYDKKGKRQTAWDYWVPGQLYDGDKTAETYAVKDTERTMMLWLCYEDLIKEMGVEKAYESEMELLPIVFNTENQGLTLNFTKLDPTVQFLNDERIVIKSRIDKLTSAILGKNINIDSPDHMKELVYGKKGFNSEVVKRTEKGNPSVDKTVLLDLFKRPTQEDWQKALLRDILLYKAYGTSIRYIKGYKDLSFPISKKWGRIYPSLNQIGAATNRFTSSNPNGQNVGKKDKVKFGKDDEITIPKLRDVFGPYPGKIWYSIDYSQIELRVFSCVSKEQSLIDALEAGYDFHGFVASRIFNKPLDKVEDSERTIAKNVNFALIFGASPRKVNATAGIPNAYELFSGQFPNASRFMKEVIEYVKQNGHVWTMDGYKLDVPYSSPYKGVNYMVQGTAGRIIKSAMRKLKKESWFDPAEINIILQIHDELIFEVRKYGPLNTPYYIRKIMDTMEEAGREMGVNCPVSTEVISKDWGHGQEIEVTETEFILAA